ncbi:MAG: hypothetical protein KatS3mg108_0204 [Isosphaeraceae bacterium]|jgi:predicted RNA-binding Zn-ribbon protein involved in translation (DUF1610 family)|nr:MAG: hypothetical protein KatS3mg108_0204 [Isosphaeraceae bacterium]
MPKAFCRCGQELTLSGESGERILCPACGARIKIRSRDEPPTTVPAPPPPPHDAFIRFYCPCGQRLKVHVDEGLTHGKCPACGRIVPVPSLPPAPHAAARTAGDPETPTADLDPADRALLERWCQEHQQAALPIPIGSPQAALGSTSSAQVSLTRARADHVESGLRICPGCRKPVHMKAQTCRHCGSTVP